jgi:hypothetical protein
MVRAMKYRVFGALVASLSVAAVMLAPNPASARSGAVQAGRGASSHPAFHPRGIRTFRHHRGSAIFWPGVDGYDYGGPTGEPLAGAMPPPSGDVHYTYTYDVPWDWAHRYPPAVTPSDRPYVSSCPAETVTVPGRGGKEQVISVMRCY